MAFFFLAGGCVLLFVRTRLDLLFPSLFGSAAGRPGGYPRGA